jgi:hypothetical protein
MGELRELLQGKGSHARAERVVARKARSLRVVEAM